MKINLEFGNATNALNGYVNVTSWPPQEKLDELPEATSIVIGQANNLDPIVEDGSCEEIIFTPLFNLVRPNDILPLLSHWEKKLKKGGSLKISFVDIRLLSRFIQSGEMDLQSIHSAVIGQNKEYESIIDTEIIKKTFSALGFSIDSISHKQFFVTIEVIK